VGEPTTARPAGVGGPTQSHDRRADVGRAERFQCGKQIASYLGLVPAEESSGDRQRLGHISKQGNTMLRFLLGEAAQVTVRSDSEWRRKFFHLAMRRGRKIAKVAMARRLAVRLYWMWRKPWDYEQLKSSVRTRDSPEQALVCNRTPSNRLGSPLPLAGEFELAIMIAVADRRDAWVGLIS